MAGGGGQFILDSSSEASFLVHWTLKLITHVLLNIKHGSPVLHVGEHLGNDGD